MVEQHPISPSPELVQQWINEKPGIYPEYLATRASQWGADRELEACCEWLHWQNLAWHSELIPSLRAARRPKSPSLKEQALESLHHLEAGCLSNIDLLRRALEAIPNE
jgi:hypothetical protein